MKVLFSKSGVEFGRLLRGPSEGFPKADEADPISRFKEDVEAGLDEFVASHARRKDYGGDDTIELVAEYHPDIPPDDGLSDMELTTSGRTSRLTPPDEATFDEPDDRGGVAIALEDRPSVSIGVRVNGAQLIPQTPMELPKEFAGKTFHDLKETRMVNLTRYGDPVGHNVEYLTDLDYLKQLADAGARVLKALK